MKQKRNAIKHKKVHRKKISSSKIFLWTSLSILLIATPLITIYFSNQQKNLASNAFYTTNNHQLTKIVATPTPQHQVTFDAEFNDRAGTIPWSGQWSFDTGGDGWGNQEREYNTNTADVASTDGKGDLVITAHTPTGAERNLRCWYSSTKPCDYVSARLITKGIFAQAYGHFEARIKMPGTVGSWPAFWLLGSDIDTVDWPACGEIDIVENYGGAGPLYIEGSAHGPLGNSYSTDYGAYNFPTGSNGVKAWHVYALDWTPTSLTYSVDGIPYKTVLSTDSALGGNWVFNQPFFIILNLAVGGSGGGSTVGAPSTMQMLVDYVKVTT